MNRMETTRQTLGNDLRKCRVACGLTQTQAEQLSGMAGATLRDVEANRADPTLDTLQKLATVYQVSIFLTVSPEVSE